MEEAAPYERARPSWYHPLTFPQAVAECERLREENARLRVRVGQAPDTLAPAPNQFSAHNNKKAQASATVTAESRPELKVSLFGSLFRGRDDVYALRWEGRSGKTGYSPAGIREWDQAPSPGCGQKKSFRHSKLFSLSEEVITDHLLGKETIGVYPLLQDDTCWFVAVDFDKKSWEADACASSGANRLIEERNAHWSLYGRS